MVRSLVLVQHGEKERAPGDPGLTRRGRAQARQAAVALEELGRPAAIYASPMRRAMETASVIGGHFDLAVHCDHRVRERINWDGEPVQSFESFIAEWERTTIDRDHLPASGDSSRQAAERMVEAIGDLAGAHPGAMVVVVTHGGVTVDLLRTLLGDEALAASAPRLVAEGVPPCALTTLRRVGTAWRVDAIASDRHVGGGHEPEA